MLDDEVPAKSLKEGLPPRDRNADVPEHSNSGAVWVGAVVALCAVLALLMFAGAGSHDTASNAPRAAQGVTTGQAPARPSDNAR